MMKYARHHLFKVGERPGHFTIIKAAEPDKKGNRYWVVRCDCREQTVKRVREDHLRDGSTSSCGCMKTQQLWERDKPTPVQGEEQTAPAEESLTAQEDKGSKIIERNDPIIVKGSIPGQCPHGKPVNETPIEGRIAGISTACWRCHDLWTQRDLIREWERVLQLDQKQDFGRRMEVGSGGVTGDHAVSGGIGSTEIETMAEEGDFMEFEPGEDGTTKRRKPARRTTPPGAGPDVDVIHED
jgi:hypothetical protein